MNRKLHDKGLQLQSSLAALEEYMEQRGERLQKLEDAIERWKGKMPYDGAAASIARLKERIERKCEVAVSLSLVLIEFAMLP